MNIQAYKIISVYKCIHASPNEEKMNSIDTKIDVSECNASENLLNKNHQLLIFLITFLL